MQNKYPYLSEYRLVEVPPGVRTRQIYGTGTRVWGVRCGVLSVQIRGQSVPVLQADLKDFSVLDFRDQNQIL